MKSPLLLPLLAAFLAAGALADGAPSEERAEAQTITVHLGWDTASEDFYPSWRLRLTDTPAEDRQAPAGAEAPRFAARSLDGIGALCLAVATSGDEGRLWVDADFNGVFDEAALPFDRHGESRFVDVELRPPTTRGLPATLPLVVEQEGDEERIVLVLAAHRTGTVVLEGRVRPVAVHVFDAPDAFYLDVDGDGAAHGPSEHFASGRPFRVRNAGYVGRTDGVLGARVTFRPADRVPPLTPSWPYTWIPRAGVAPRAIDPRVIEEVEAAYAAWKKEEDGGLRSSGLRALLGPLRGAGSKEVFQLLHRVYREWKVEPACQAIAVGYMRNAGFLPFAAKVRKMARHRDPGVAVEAIESLHGIGVPDRVTIYTTLLRSRDDAVFAAAARYLGYAGTPESTKTLLGLLSRRLPPGRAPVVYEAATRPRKAPPSAALLERCAAAHDPELRAAALRDAARVAPALAQRLALAAAARAGESEGLRRAVIDILGAWGDGPSVAAALPLAEGASGRTLRRLTHRLALVRSPGAAAALVAGLASRHADVRVVAALALAEVPGAGVAEAVVARLTAERDARVLEALCEAAARHGHDAAIGPLIALARRKPRPGLLEAVLEALAAIDPADEEVAACFRTLMRSSRESERLAALDAAAATEDPAAAELLVGGLADRSPRVRLSAARGLGLVRAGAAVPPLIDALGKEKDDDVRQELARTLYRTTGTNLYDEVDAWRRWWREHGDGFEVPDEITEPPRLAGGHRYGSFYGVPVSSDRIVFVIDKSGSMSSPGSRSGEGDEPEEPKNDLDRAVDATLAVVEALPPTARINVVLFESEFQAWKRALVRLDRRTRRALEQWLWDQAPTGGTNLYDPLEWVLRMEGVESVYLLSDGQPGSGRFVEDDDIVREIRLRNAKRRIPIHCVVLGYDSELLRRLAKDSGGTYVRR